jgi:cytochrome b561
MPWRNFPDRYGSLSIGLHWFMLLLLVGVYSCIELREFFPKGSDLLSWACLCWFWLFFVWRCG